MRIFNVGPCDLSQEYDLREVKEDDYQWIVYWYEYESYEGQGEAVALRKDGTIVVKDLGHCSCYGPMDEWETGCSSFSKNEFLAKRESVHDYYNREEVMAKVLELLTE